jgi:hypothetical protein
VHHSRCPIRTRVSTLGSTNGDGKKRTRTTKPLSLSLSRANDGQRCVRWFGCSEPGTGSISRTCRLDVIAIERRRSWFGISRRATRSGAFPPVRARLHRIIFFTVSRAKATSHSATTRFPNRRPPVADPPSPRSSRSSRRPTHRDELRSGCCEYPGRVDFWIARGSARDRRAPRFGPDGSKNIRRSIAWLLIETGVASRRV